MDSTDNTRRARGAAIYALPYDVVIDVTAKNCSICFDPFDNDDDVFEISCGGHHIVCSVCVEAWDDHEEDEMLENEFPYNEEKPMLCPVCRQDAEVKVVGTAQNFYIGGGGTQATAIAIDPGSPQDYGKTEATAIKVD